MLTSPVIQLNYGEVRTHRLDDSTVSYKKILFTYWLGDLSARWVIGSVTHQLGDSSAQWPDDPINPATPWLTLIQGAPFGVSNQGGSVTPEHSIHLYA